MNTKKIIYHGATTIFGVAHLVVQTTADIIAATEAEIVAKTGDWQGGKQKAVNKDDYKKYVSQRTADIQAQTIARVKALYNNKKLAL